MSRGTTVKVRFHAPPPALRACFTSFYVVDMARPGGGEVEDQLHPEWANLRLFAAPLARAEIAGKPPVNHVRAVFSGPTSTCVRFAMGSTRLWGIGFLPLGWAQFIAGDAADFADGLFELDQPPFSAFASLAQTLFGPEPDEAAELQRLSDWFLARQTAVPDEERISALHAALVDPDVASVADLVGATGIARHTIERLCRRTFGFAPSLLLRRQRFMRSLSQFMLDPSLNWIGAIDGHYHDQSQFVRDFRRFMGTTPRQYAATPHPVLSAVMRARQEAAGAAVQALHLPLLPTPMPG